MTVELSSALRAAAAHFDVHPELVDTALNVEAVREEGIRVHAHGDTARRLPVLAAWIRTLGDVKHVEVRGVIDEPFPKRHLYAIGHLPDGVPIRVVVIVHGAEVALLAANTRIDADATFGADLVLRLTESASAEAAVSHG
jgi:phosphoribosylcarboxyaminoimidazole (NCAIR) mutase